ncbi:hypothetical protein PVAP13_7KG122251 [Panicum virgatum]|uniref:Uncharacterized protein n=1 Tax=Panicum virgatum TaxID=38727 RepID=A0A8T0QDG9_PANVG|nr:hypothetical protein PVAP13_7KG122251 [Panicum virgatum]
MSHAQAAISSSFIYTRSQLHPRSHVLTHAAAVQSFAMPARPRPSPVSKLNKRLIWFVCWLLRRPRPVCRAGRPPTRPLPPSRPTHPAVAAAQPDCSV